MSLWIVIAGMAAAAAAILLFPFVRKGRGAARESFDLAVYRDQLAEVARDESRGTLSGAEAAAARLEIERRILGVDAARPSPAPARRSLVSRATLIAAAVVGPLAAIALYLDLGAPDMPGHPFAERAAAGAGTAAPVDMGKIEQMVEGLAARLARQPDDLKGWFMLARSYAVLQRYEEAAAAFAHAATLDPKDANLPASEGEALVFASGGVVTPKARDAFEAALALDANEPRARFYLGLASMQAGEPRAALATWEALAADAPKDAPWLASLQQQIAKLREMLGIKPGDEPPEKSTPGMPKAGAP